MPGRGASGDELERPAGAGTPPACKVFCGVVPVVSLVPRSTTGYKLESLRDKEFRCFRHEPCGRVGFQGIELARKFDRNEVV
jgi:hypothetical protein